MATLLVLVVLFSVTSSSFATWDNLTNILQQISVTAIIAVGLTFVILCAEIDLSVATVANAAGVVLAFCTAQEASVNIANLPLPGAAAIVVALVAALALGAVTAAGVTIVGIPSFIMTLAMLQIASGVSAAIVLRPVAFHLRLLDPGGGADCLPELAGLGRKSKASLNTSLQSEPL
ncbi:MAG: hypothetical protein M3Y41_13965 [Pseudomonadota bacterium]|nr:hypothetical protein [Pseudomonadota bacterium]